LSPRAGLLNCFSFSSCFVVDGQVTTKPPVDRMAFVFCSHVRFVLRRFGQMFHSAMFAELKHVITTPLEELFLL